MQEGTRIIHQADLNERRRRKQSELLIRAIDFDKQQDALRDDERLVHYHKMLQYVPIAVCLN